METNQLTSFTLIIALWNEIGLITLGKILGRKKKNFTCETKYL